MSRKPGGTSTGDPRVDSCHALPTGNKKLKKKGHVDPKKQLILYGVNIPQRREPVKEEPNEATIPPSDPHIVMPPPMVYDTPAQPFDIGNDYVFMEDVSHEPTKVPKPKKKTSLPKTHPDGAPLTIKPEHFDLRSCNRPPMEVDELPKEKKNPPPKQQSDLQRQLNVDNLVDKVLGTPMTVTLCKLLSTSPMASKKILDYLPVT